MIVNTDNLVSIEEVNKDFSKIAHKIDESGMAIILKDNKPFYMVTDFSEYETIQELQKSSAAKTAGSMTAYDPPIEINVEQYRAQHPLSALICYGYAGTREYKKKNEGLLLFEGSVREISLLYEELIQFGKKEYYCIMPEYWLNQMKKIFKSESSEMADRLLSKSSQSREGKIMNIFDHTSDKHWDIVFFGQLKTLFGEPLYTTYDVENQYSYCISATDKNNNTIYFNVNSGATGPAIGGGFFQDNPKVTKEDRKKMARLLISYILQAKPSDYDYEGQYENDIIIKEGIRNGKSYHKIEEIEEIPKDENETDIDYWVSAIDKNNNISDVHIIETTDNFEPSKQEINDIIQIMKEKGYITFFLIGMGIKNGCPFYAQRQIYDISETDIQK